MGAEGMTDHMSDNREALRLALSTPKPELANEILTLRAENKRLRLAIVSHGAEACGILRSYHEEDGKRLWLALRNAMMEASE